METGMEAENMQFVMAWATVLISYKKVLSGEWDGAELD